MSEKRLMDCLFLLSSGCFVSSAAFLCTCRLSLRPPPCQTSITIIPSSLEWRWAFVRLSVFLVPSIPILYLRRASRLKDSWRRKRTTQRLTNTFWPFLGGWREGVNKWLLWIEEEKQCAYRLIEGCTQNRLMRLETSQLCWKKNVDRSSSYYDPKSLTRDVQVEMGAKYRGGGEYEMSTNFLHLGHFQNLACICIGKVACILIFDKKMHVSRPFRGGVHVGGEDNGCRI